ncbi:SigE family RNA polymerase sigma factor [Spirilliplanes yamanashiensis]|uniref:DNA-directed RNA polymerase sigma-70 factor n=1 Tax=Spirilliplanes yamanashiensis TaxID=42233 RepID=A0A8J3Y893_9ACTN|nr:SigE family RNA polymerase sigma factor [Spirilliplanes yamanashiensis]MDP9815542.1 RNA polymerase sigma-70 factor (sigma-E family) [Spirilliplanes yamanashiensis]GIJ03796.1 DNA-directed RNA polymerase sigma-70 factor [Spirilliplanes yamanashiensis]
MRPSTEQEFLAFVAAATPALFRVAYALTGQQQAAEDLLQSALERVAARWRRIDDPGAYARTVMYHEQISWWRRWKRREVVVARPPERVADDPAAGVALRLSLRAALDRLGPRQRAVLVLRYLEDRPEAEVARLLGCSPKTVASQASRGLARLRELCPELGSLEEAR